MVRQLFASEQLDLWSSVDSNGLPWIGRWGPRDRRKAGLSGDSGQTRLESGGGGIRTLERPVTSNGFRDRCDCVSVQPPLDQASRGMGSPRILAARTSVK